MSTVPVFAPDGTLGDIPQAQLVAAVKAGASPGVNITDPQGNPGVVPASRMQEAVGAGAKVVPFKDQDVQHPGFWGWVQNALAPREVPSSSTGGQTNDIPGYEGNIGDEGKQEAMSGMGVAAGAALAAPAVVGAASKLAAKHPVVASMALSSAIGEARKIPYVGKFIPPGAEILPWLIGKGGEPAEEGGVPVERDATLDQRNVPAYAGEEPPPTPAAPAAPAPTGAPVYRDATLNKRNIPEYAGEEIPEAKLPEATGSVIDQAIPPKGESYGANLRTKAQVEFALQRGDVAGAEAAMDQAAAEANPAYKPPANRAAPTAKPPVAELPTFHDPNLPPHPYANPPQGVVPSVQNIRENEAMSAAAEAEPNRPTPDSMEDHALSQEMQWNLEREGYAAESQARREFIARNSTGVTKGELVKKAQTAGEAPPEDLTPQWQKALDAIKEKKNGGTPSVPPQP